MMAAYGVSDGVVLPGRAAGSRLLQLATKAALAAPERARFQIVIHRSDSFH
jgi:hypothetical protein